MATFREGTVTFTFQDGFSTAVPSHVLTRSSTLRDMIEIYSTEGSVAVPAPGGVLKCWLQCLQEMFLFLPCQVASPQVASPQPLLLGPTDRDRAVDILKVRNLFMVLCAVPLDKTQCHPRLVPVQSWQQAAPGYEGLLIHLQSICYYYLVNMPYLLPSILEIGSVLPGPCSACQFADGRTTACSPSWARDERSGTVLVATARVQRPSCTDARYEACIQCCNVDIYSDETADSTMNCCLNWTSYTHACVTCLLLTTYTRSQLDLVHSCVSPVHDCRVPSVSYAAVGIFYTALLRHLIITWFFWVRTRLLASTVRARVT